MNRKRHFIQNTNEKNAIAFRKEHYFMVLNFRKSSPQTSEAFAGNGKHSDNMGENFECWKWNYLISNEHSKLDD